MQTYPPSHLLTSGVVPITSYSSRSPPNTPLFGAASTTSSTLQKHLLLKFLSPVTLTPMHHTGSSLFNTANPNCCLCPLLIPESLRSPSLTAILHTQCTSPTPHHNHHHLNHPLCFTPRLEAPRLSESFLVLRTF